jgi:hypothetical protein
MFYTPAILGSGQKHAGTLSLSIAQPARKNSEQQSLHRERNRNDQERPAHSIDASENSRQERQ